MKHELFDIWEDYTGPWGDSPFRVQLVNYVGHFPSQVAAEQFVESTKKARTQAAKAGTKSK